METDVLSFAVQWDISRSHTNWYTLLCDLHLEICMDMLLPLRALFQLSLHKEHLAVPSMELEWQLLSKGLVSNHASEWWQSLLLYNGTNSIRQPVALRWWNMVLQLSGGFCRFLNHHIWLVFLFWQYILLNLTFCLGWEVDMNNDVSI